MNKFSGIYIHFPFCVSKCIYCDYFGGLKLNTELYENYINTILKEVLLRKNEYRYNKFNTIYFGGGTPSLMKVEDIERILNELYKNFDLYIQEITLEINPETISKDYISSIKKMGINRVSLGFQSMDDGVLNRMKRRNNKRINIECYEICRELDLNISIDFINSFPGDNITSLESIINLNPDHISVYSLTVSENTELFHLIKDRKIIIKTEEELQKDYELATGLLGDNGYKQYEISNYAKNNKYSIHNLHYWNYDEYLGLGAGAYGFYSNIRYENTRKIYDYFKLKDFEVKEEISKYDMIKEIIMLGLRKVEGIDFNTFKEKTGIDFKEIVNIQKLYDKYNSYFDIYEDRINIKKDFLFQSNYLILAIWELIDIKDKIT